VKTAISSAKKATAGDKRKQEHQEEEEEDEGDIAEESLDELRAQVAEAQKLTGKLSLVVLQLAQCTSFKSSGIRFKGIVS
jgi:hypothetical protein